MNPAPLVVPDTLTRLMASDFAPPAAIALALAIITFIEGGSENEADFNALALGVFAYQYENDAPYRRFCDGKRATPQTVSAWFEIPPAPAQAFKRFALTCASEDDCVPGRGGRIFHSSGTTGSETSRHFLDASAVAVYEASLRAGYKRGVPRWTAGILALMPPPRDAPHSSLSFMLDALDKNIGFHWDKQGEYDWTEILALWMKVQRKPYTVFGTAFAWVHFLDSTTENFQLPEDCLIIETGGFKGRSREVSRDDLYASFTERLGTPPENCGAEYGMSEMASQFYDACLSTGVAENPPRKLAPPWLKTRVLDPVTEQEVPTGVPGLLAHYDLANLNSVLAIQTEDMGYAHADGGIVLLGRAPGAILRGCSLTAEELFRVSD